jgi:hypothetical protein
MLLPGLGYACLNGSVSKYFEVVNVGLLVNKSPYNVLVLWY